MGRAENRGRFLNDKISSYVKFQEIIVKVRINVGQSEKFNFLATVEAASILLLRKIC